MAQSVATISHRGVLPGARVRAFVSQHAVLIISAVVTLLTMFIVPPDAAYAGYLDWKTLGCLFCILAVVGALRNIGVFERGASALVRRFATCRTAVFALVFATLVISMIATNDMALIMMLPLAAATLVRAGWLRVLPFTFIMQNMAANLGGMIVPFGNPQNLYLFEYFSITVRDFLSTMSIPFVVSVVLIAVCCYFRVKPLAIDAVREAAAAKGESLDASTRKRLVLYAGLMLLTIATVFRLVPFELTVCAVVGALMFADRQALRTLDYPLLLTFACFFVFAGNMARIPAVDQLLSGLMGGHPLLVSSAVSQVISNVPAAVLLSHFTTSYPALLVGVNIGGAGTLVASLASLITFQQYQSARRSFAREGRDVACLSTMRFLGLFAVYNVAFLGILEFVCMFVLGYA